MVARRRPGFLHDDARRKADELPYDIVQIIDLTTGLGRELKEGVAIGRVARHPSSFYRSDELRLLDIMGTARDLAIKMGSAAGFNSERYGMGRALMEAIDVLAEEFTGDRKHFHSKGSTGPNYGQNFAHVPSTWSEGSLMALITISMSRRPR